MLIIYHQKHNSNPFSAEDAENTEENINFLAKNIVTISVKCFIF